MHSHLLLARYAMQQGRSDARLRRRLRRAALRKAIVAARNFGAPLILAAAAVGLGAQQAVAALFS